MKHIKIFKFIVLVVLIVVMNYSSSGFSYIPKTKIIVKTEPISITKEVSFMTKYIKHINKGVSDVNTKLISSAISKASNKYNIPSEIILSIIDQESDFRIKVESNKNSLGLMQINYKVWLSKNNKYNLIDNDIITSRKDLYDIEKNIMAGSYILNHYHNKCLSMSPGLLSVKGFHNVWECTLIKYFGGNYKKYYKGVLKEMGNVLLYSLQIKS